MKITKPIVVNGLFVMIGVLALVTSFGYRLGTPGRMGPGFFPVGVSALLIGIGALGVLRAMLSRAPGEALPTIRLRPILVIIAAVVVFGLLVQSWGVLPATIALLAMGRLAGPAPTTLQLGFTVGVLTVVSIGLFKYALGINLHLLR